MVQDTAWDNSAAPPPRKPGLGTAGKVLIGCGAAALCLVLAVGAMAWMVYEKATTAMDRGWVSLHRELDSLGTPEGARRLYRENPGLAQNYASEEEFVRLSADWRERLGELPEKRPSLKDLLGHKGGGPYAIQAREQDGRHQLVVRVRLARGGTLVVEMENDKLTDIRAE